MINFQKDLLQKENRITTSNGVNIYSLKNGGLHGFCLCLYARAGILYEKQNINGISHFVEHIVFRNINLLMNGQLYDNLDKTGLTFTAATYKEFMQFCIMGESSKLPLASEIITKIFEVLNKAGLKEDFEIEKGRIRAEIREYDEKASLDYAVKKKVFEGTNLSDMITGTQSSISKISISKCEIERKRIFSSGNFFFYLTGNFEDNHKEYLAELVENYKFDKNQPRKNYCEIPVNYMNRNCEVVMKDGAYCMVEISFDMDTQKFSKAERGLFYDIMFAGGNCRFFKELSENTGYIYSYDARIEEYKNLGNLTVSFEVDYKNLYKSLTIAIEMFNSLKKDAAGLSRAKVYYTDNACLLLDNSEELNWNMAYENHILGEKSQNLKERIEKYDSVTEERICLLAKEIFKTTNLVFGIKGRKKKIDSEKIVEIMKKLTF